MNQEKKNKHVGAKLAIVIIIAYLLLPLVMTLIYSLFQEWVDIMPTGFTLGAYTELFSDPLFWEQAVLLKYHSDITVFRILVCDIFPIQQDLSAGNLLQPCQAAQKGTLSTSGRPQQCNEIAFVNFQINPL